MVEVDNGRGFICHEECWQQSGEDDGEVERMHKVFEEGEDEDKFIGSY